MHVIISGGGIGGLTAALACHHFGHDVMVLEQAPELGEVGAGLQLSPNAMKVFQALSLESEIAKRAFQPEAIELRMGISGSSLLRAPLGEAAITRWGVPYYHIHRADLISVLETALRSRSPNAITLGRKVSGYASSADHATATLQDESFVTGDILIGADGIHSAIRDQMLGSDKPIFTGNVAWRAVVPVDRLGSDIPNPTACAWMGRGKHAVTYLLRGGELANLVAVVERDDWTTESWTEKGSKEEALADFTGWHPTITRLMTEADELYRWALFDRAPLKSWTEGRVALLGDAAHPMLPFMAQGAAMAIEDAWVLAAQLSGKETPKTALKNYEKIRYNRATKVQAASSANAKRFHHRTVIGRLANYGPMWAAGRIAPNLLHNRQDWIYGHDVTAKT